jgi:leucyl aminopeptidase
MDPSLDGLSRNGCTTYPLHAVTQAGFQAFMSGLAAEAAAFLAASGFTAAAHEVRLLPGPQGLAGAVLGLGEAPDDPFSYGGAPFALPAGSVWHVDGVPNPMAATLGWLLGAYRFTRLHSRPARAPALLRPPAGSDATILTAEAICRGRDLINLPASHLGPAELADSVMALAARHGARGEIIDGAALAEGFPAVQAVGGGALAERAPRVAILRWEGAADAPLVVLCGKGVCFDSGGLDLKPAAAMLRMKKDMGGAATMMTVAELIMARRVPVRLVLLVGAVENAVSAAAFRPGDVIRTRKGLSVEIGNTDAEGRLVLADLLTFAGEMQPAVIIDGATLTGAARVALGPDLPALFANDELTAEAILAAGRAIEDPAWRLPLQKNYLSWLDSSAADINNVSTKPMAGAIVAALFLQQFVPSATRWCHFDLYAWNDQTRPGRPEGGEIQGARAIVDGLVSLFATHTAIERPLT